MEIKNLIDAKAEITRVVTLHKGDLYKRVQKRDDDSDDITLIVGKVTEVLNNGNDVAVSAIEIKKDRYYGKPEINLVSFGGDQDVVVFPLTEDEIKIQGNSVIDGQIRSIRDTERELQKKNSDLESMRELFGIKEDK